MAHNYMNGSKKELKKDRRDKEVESDAVYLGEDPQSSLRPDTEEGSHLKFTTSH